MCKRPFPLSSRSIRIIYVFAAIILPALLFWQFKQAFAMNALPYADKSQFQTLNNTIIPPAQTNTQSTLIRHYASPQIHHNTQSLAWGDMDGDGDLDLAVGNRRNQPNHIYENKGQGNFSTWNLSDVPNNTQSLAWGDMDGDGDLDLAVGNAGNWDGECLCFQGAGARNEIYRNDGVIDGQVKFTQLPLGTDAKHTLSVAWGDIDGDGYLDLVVGNWGAVNQIYQNNEGQLDLVPGNPLGSDKNYTASVALGNIDIDEDSDLDLAVGNGGWSKSTGSYQMEVNLLYRNISENRQIKFELVPSALGTDAKLTTSVAWGDLEGDGDLDLAIGNWGQPLGGGDVNQVLLNDGTGKFTAEDVITINDEKNTRSVAWGDIDGDGDLDLAVANEHGNGGGQTDQIYRYDKEQNSFTILEIDRELDQAETNSMGWGDMDGDGDLDLAVGSAFGGTLFIYRNTRQPYLEPSDLPEGQPSHTEIVAWGDVDKDGHLDLAVGNLANGNYVYHNDGQGNFTPFMLPDSKNAHSMAWGDMDGDGDLDLAVGTGGEGGIPEVNQVYENITTTTGKRKFELVPNALGSDAQDTFSVAWGDMDGDGDLDLAVGNNNDVNQLYENTDGKGTFELVPGGLGEDKDWTHSLAWGDMDGDGDLDLAVGNWQGQPSQILINNGEGDFSPINLGTEARGAESVAWGDMDGDGDLDLAVANRLHTNVVFRNEGQGRFVPLTLDNLTKNSQSIAWGDMDGDGDLDLAVGNYGVDQIYINGGLGNFSPYDLIHTSIDNRTASVAWGDMDGDGDLDLALGTYNRNLILTNDIQIVSPTPDLVPFISVGGPNDSSANFYATSNIVNGRVISIPFKTFGAESDRIRWIKAEYSLDGGGQWRPAVAHSETITTNLAVSSWPTGTAYTYAWDTFASGLFGRSDNVVFRITAYSQSPAVSPNIAGTYRYTDSVAGPFQRPFASATTYPFRVRGTQVQVFNEVVQSGNEVQGAFVYRLPKNGQTAMVIGSHSTNIAFESDQSGYLNGRGQLNIADELLATLPVTQTYRLAPQIYFPDEVSTVRAALSNSRPTDTLSIEFWLRPLSPDGGLLILGDGMALFYRTITDTAAATTTLTLKIGENSVSTSNVNLLDGRIHQMALTWESSQDQNNTIFYIDGRPIFTGTLGAGFVFTETPSLILGQGYIGAMDEIRLWKTVRLPAQILTDYGRYQSSMTDFWPTVYGDDGALFAEQDTALIGYWPTGERENEVLRDFSTNGNDARMNGHTAVIFKPHYTVYYTSGQVTDTVGFQPVIEPGVQTLIVSPDNPLLLFDLDVSLEWDPRNESAFLSELKASFERASELLYDVTNGQAALRQVNFYYNKAFWGQADIVIFADNSLRPSAAIGGIVNKPIPEVVINRTTGLTETVSEAYVPGHIRMGTVWDPFGERTADLGEEWSRALAHELAHYFFFLPDNYLGYKVENEDVLGLVDCQGSFMTNNIDPAYSEFLIRGKQWNPTPAENDPCERTLADRTTGRTDWDTITHFYPMLKAPPSDDDLQPGPSILPLNIIEAVTWTFADESTVDEMAVLASRNFILRTGSNVGEVKLRLSNAQGYLIKTQGTTDPTDDLLIRLGTPTGGGDRLKVRGAEEGDRLCLFGSSSQTRYAGCDRLQRTDASLLVNPIEIVWEPDITIQSDDGRIISVTVQFDTQLENELNVQIYPLHYMAVSGLAPTVTLQTGDRLIFTNILTLPLPAYEVAARIWAAGEEGQREAITTYRLNPGEWGTFAIPVSLTLETVGQPFTGGPINMPTGGPINMPTGGPINMPTGGPINMPTGGPINMPTGGPINMPTGGPINMPTGGPINMPTGGPTTSSYAPILSADAQVVIYNSKGFFEDNGVISLQALPEVPQLPDWLIPVGQAYHIENSPTMTDSRYISFNYLQRNVPEGFEDTLKIYFLPDCPEAALNCVQQWQPVNSSQRFVENLVVAPLVTQTVSNDSQQGSIGQDGVYAVLSTLVMPQLQPEWNLFSFPLLVTRTVESALASIAGSYSEIYEVQATSGVTEAIVRDNISSIYIRSGPGTEYSVVGYLRRNEGATVIGGDANWLQIDCPDFARSQTECWVTGHAAFVWIDKNPGISLPATLTPSTGNLKTPTEFRSNGVYWIYVTAVEPVTLYLAPPIRQISGEVR